MAREEFRYKSELRVRFGETDLQGVVFNANYLLYVDTAQMDYLRFIGVPYRRLLEGGHDIVIVDASVQFISPARFDDVLEIYARISEIGNSSVKMAFEIHEPGAARLVAKARTAYVLIEKETKRPVRVPPYIRAAAREFEARPDFEAT